MGLHCSKSHFSIRKNSLKDKTTPAEQQSDHRFLSLVLESFNWLVIPPEWFRCWKQPCIGSQFPHASFSIDIEMCVTHLSEQAWHL